MNDLKVSRVAGEAMAQAMYTHTFGIVSDSAGTEGKGLGTGVGVFWRGRYLIATAKHVVEDTTAERIYYLLPGDALRIAGSSASMNSAQECWQLRCTLENPRILFAANDLAVILLPEQLEEAGKKHFYALDESHNTPAPGTTLGYLGYPAACAQPVGKNYGALPYHAFGEICVPSCSYNAYQDFAISYTPGNDIDPPGLSGSGAWWSRSSGKVWSPQISLAGLVTHYYRRSQVLICCRVELLTSFLKQKDAAISC